MTDSRVMPPARAASPPAWLSLPVSSALHLAALGALAAASFLSAGSIRPPALREVMIFLPPPPGPARVAPAPLRGVSRKPDVEEKKLPVPEKLPEMIQPPRVPEAAPPAPEAMDEAAGLPDGIDDGDPEGVEGGARGGDRDGVPFGDPNGIPGGDPHGIPGGTGTSGALDEEPIRLTGAVRPPVLLRKVTPDYPEIARISRREGKVILEIVVGRDGEVEGVTILRSDPLFDEAAAEAVRRWEYEPALQSGRPVKVLMTVVVQFRLK